MTTFVSPETRWKYKMSHLRALVYSHEPFSNIMSSIRQTMDSYVSLMEVGMIKYSAILYPKSLVVRML